MLTLAAPITRDLSAESPNFAFRPSAAEKKRLNLTVDLLAKGRMPA
jgi:hypothetical protein